MLSYNAKRYINKQLVLFGLFAIVGIIVLILGTFFNILKDEMIGICAGLIPTGLLGVIVTLSMKNKPEKTERIVRIKTEERLQLIRCKAGNLSYWITFSCLCICTIAARYLDISLTLFLVITILSMVAINTVVSIIYHRIL